MIQSVFAFTYEEVSQGRTESLPWEFDVEKSQLQTQDGAMTESFAIRRKDNRKVLGVCTDTYTPVNYGQVIMPVLEHLVEREQHDDISIEYMEKKNGARASWEIVIGEEIPIGNTAVGDIVCKSLIVQSSHDLSRGVRVMAGVKVLACLNGMVIPQSTKILNQRHMAWDGQIYNDNIAALLESSMLMHDDAIDTFRKWQETAVSSLHIAELTCNVIDKKFPAKYKKDVSDLVLHALAGKNRMSLWEYYNLITDKTSIKSMQDLFAMAEITPEIHEMITPYAA